MSENEPKITKARILIGRPITQDTGGVVQNIIVGADSLEVANHLAKGVQMAAELAGSSVVKVEDSMISSKEEFDDLMNTSSSGTVFAAPKWDSNHPKASAWKPSGSAWGKRKLD